MMLKEIKTLYLTELCTIHECCVLIILLKTWTISCVESALAAPCSADEAMLAM